MLLRLAACAPLAAALVFGAVWLGSEIFPIASPRPESPAMSLELLEPSRWEVERRAVAELRAFLAVAPARRFREAVAAADVRALAVGGGPSALEGAPVLTIPGTADPPLSRERAELVLRAREYARAYNLLHERRAAESAAPPPLPALSPSSSAAARSPERTAPSGDGATR